MSNPLQVNTKVLLVMIVITALASLNAGVQKMRPTLKTTQWKGL
ncbi:hypothetical protein [Alkalicoccobacillus porphyridii]|nr:hypothetical protein [Alkalicoccobacillus porphyridii]